MDKDTEISIFTDSRGDWHFVETTTLGAFFEANEFSEAEQEEISNALRERGEYIGGGGAAAGFLINEVIDPRCPAPGRAAA